MNQEQALALVGRLFTAFGRQPSEAQLDEWVKAQKRFNFRPDDTNAAIDSLINTSNRMPTIAELRTAIVSVQNQRLSQAGQQVEVPGWVRRMNNEHLKEDFEWWNERFGSLAPQARALIGEACTKGRARMSMTIARLINEMHREGLPFSDRWERLKDVTSGKSFTITPTANIAASVFSEF